MYLANRPSALGGGQRAQCRLDGSSSYKNLEKREMMSRTFENAIVPGLIEVVHGSEG